MCWREIGKELQIPNGILNSIYYACGEFKNALWCCKIMLGNWLSLDVPKSWDCILQAITSPEVAKIMENTCIPSEFFNIRNIGKVICHLACEIQINSIKLRHTPLSDNWPLTKPQHFTSVAIIHYKKGIKKEIIKLIAEIQQDGVSHDVYIDNHSAGKFSNVKNHKDLSELFVNDPKCVLIEGAPGIGKTTLAEEIVFQWSLGNILQKKKLVLLIPLRDLVYQTITSFENLIKHSKSLPELKNTNINILQNYMTENQADRIALILDGYDELPIKNIQNSEYFINKLIGKRINTFTKCMLIVTSRPNVSIHLHKMVDHRVEILGFTEANRMEYIKEALKGSKNNIEMLQKFLHNNPAINSYCYIPLNMAMFLYLFNELGSDSKLPTTQTGINKLFICYTISRYIEKTSVKNGIKNYEDVNSELMKEIKKQSDKINSGITISDFSKIPTPFNKIFLEMCAYSFDTLKDGKIVFEKNEIKDSCPHLIFNPKTWNGLGLLKAVQFYNILEQNVSFNFLHLSIQEMLAAYHVTLLSDGDQINLLKKTFWDPKYYNMWIMYVGLTKGQSFSFKHFLSGNFFPWFTRKSVQKNRSVSISRTINADRIKCLYLFQCFSEAEDTEMCKYVGQLLQDGDINLSQQTLNPIRINSLSLFLTQTNIKQWKSLNLSNCKIEDDRLSILYASISSNSRSMINIDTLDLSFNHLTEISTGLILSLVITWNVRKLNITSNNICFHIIINEFIGSLETKQGSMEIHISSEKEIGLIVSNKAYVTGPGKTGLIYM